MLRSRPRASKDSKRKSTPSPIPPRRPPGKGLQGVLQDRPQAHRPRKLDERGEAHLIALACGPAPEGHDHWTLRLLAGKVVELGLASSMSHEGVRKRLKKTPSSRGRRKEWRIPAVSAEFVAHMEDVLDLCQEPHNPQGRWSALTGLPPSCWRRPGRLCCPGGKFRGVRTANTGGRGPATCSWPASP